LAGFVRNATVRTVTDGSAYWRSAAEDEAMQDAHAFIWKAMLASVEEDIAGCRILDVGCNRGGFLRLCCDQHGAGEGFGYDVAAAAVEDARRLAGSRPLRFEVGDTVPTGWGGFDLAFSHEVLYLIHDMPSHAAGVFDALTPGAPYYATIGVHASSPLMVDWHEQNAEELRLPPLYRVEDLAEVFAGAGFAVEVARLKIGFVPVSGSASRRSCSHHAAGADILRSLEYYSEHKLLLRLRKPPAPG
jgi:SAM-dependent methyltransferase